MDKFQSNTDNKEEIIKLYDYTKKSLNKYMNNNSKVNILIVGKTGVGKTTLINELFQENYVKTGVGKPVTKSIKEVTKPGSLISIYDTEGLEIMKYENLTKELIDFIEEKRNNIDTNEHIHILWYCINENSKKFEEGEIDLINKIIKYIPVIIILTKFIDDDMELLNYVKYRCPDVKSVLKIRSKTIEINKNLKLPPYNLKTLIDETNKELPEGVRNAFITVQNASFKLKKEKSIKIIKNSSLISLTAGLLPMPYDILIILFTEINMIINISLIFGFEFFDIITILFFGTGGLILFSLMKKILLIFIIRLFPEFYSNRIIKYLFSFISYVYTKKYGLLYISIINMAFNKKHDDFITINDLKFINKKDLEVNSQENLIIVLKNIKLNLKKMIKYIFDDFIDNLSDILYKRIKSKMSFFKKKNKNKKKENKN